MGEEMYEHNLTDAELERILRDSRFPNERHKKDLYDRIFTKQEYGGIREFRKTFARIPELLPEELEMVAGGKADIPGMPQEETNREM